MNTKQYIQTLENKINYLVGYVNELTKPSPYTLYEWLDEWLETYRKPKIRPHSYANISQIIRIHIKPNIQNCNLDNLTAIKIQQALNKVPTSRMCKYTYDVYHASLLQAYKLGYVRKNVMLSIEPPKHQRITGRALTLEEQTQFLQAIQGNRLEKLYKFYLLSGVRMSEAFNITKKDVLTTRNLIHIKGTKTPNSDRYIPLFPQLKQILDSIETNERFFPYNSNIVICNFKRIKQKNNFVFTIHSLRHTFATRCLECGISLKMVQQWLGHAKFETTANIYMHVQLQYEQIEVQKFTYTL